MQTRKLQIAAIVLCVLALFVVVWCLRQSHVETAGTTDPSQKGLPGKAFDRSPPEQANQPLSSMQNTPAKRDPGPNLEDVKTTMLKILPVDENHYLEIKSLGSPDGKNWNSSHSMSLDADQRGFFSLYSKSGELIKTFPASINVSPSREPEKTEYNANNITWQWLDEKRIIGVQEIDYRDDPDPYADVKSDVEITISAPGGAKIYLFDINRLDEVCQLDIPQPGKGFAVHLDGIGKDCVIALSARSPLGYNQHLGDLGENPKHTRNMGFFQVEASR